MKEQPLTRQLAPLIIFILLVIVLTLVIRGSRSDTDSNSDLFETRASQLKMKLSPFSYNQPRPSARPGGPRITIPEVEQTLSLAAMDCEKGRYAVAEDRLRTALVFHPENRSLLSMLGTTFYLQQKYKEAEEIFRNLAYLDPSDSVAYNNLGAALARQKRYREAIASVEKVYKKEPDSPITALNLSGMHSMAGNTAEALEYFKKAYQTLGERILPLSYNTNFDNIRKEKDFMKIVQEAREKSSLYEKAPPQNGTEIPPAPEKGTGQ
ncbi:MAG: lipoprotein NlpI [Lentisphaerae bacterium ADurb.Bin242]|nr:MAG: lipoprotein NlpI [Lentisphaerae bacterium ADurb.Bin242]